MTISAITVLERLYPSTDPLTMNMSDYFMELLGPASLAGLIYQSNNDIETWAYLPADGNLNYAELHTSWLNQSVHDQWLNDSFIQSLRSTESSFIATLRAIEIKITRYLPWDDHMVDNFSKNILEYSTPGFELIKSHKIIF